LNESADDVTFSPGTIAWNDGLVTYAGPAEGYSGATESLENSCVVPGFVDCHTHLPFFGWRADEFEARLAGRSYRDLHGEGGISRSASMLASASDEEALEFCLPLVAEMTEYGTTAFEMKTGYGLSVEAEMRQARLARLLAAQIPQTTTLTLLVCHAVPQGMTRPDWVHAATNELIPAAAAEGLADMVDIYIEDIAFTVDDLVAVAEAAMTVGLPVRCHADQLGPSGAAEAAVRFGLRSADHLNHVSADGIAALGTADSTAAVLLPASTLMLRAQQPPVRELIDAGSIVALSSDFNPGTSPVLSMPEVFALGCSLYELSPAEALTATTSNPAWVLGLHDRLGTLAPGKRADFLVLDSKDVSGVPYRPGHNPVVHTFIGGVRAASRSSGP
jgi:imidazolonepropionase